VTVKDDMGATTTSKPLRISVIESPSAFDLSVKWTNAFSTDQGKQFYGKIELANTGRQGYRHSSGSLCIFQRTGSICRRSPSEHQHQCRIEAGRTKTMAINYRSDASIVEEIHRGCDRRKIARLPESDETTTVASVQCPK